MAELDIEALKRRLTQYHYVANDRHSYEHYAVRATDMNQAIAALEDRDRLRAAARWVIEDWDDGEEPGLTGSNDALRAALEGRDG